MRIIVDAFGGDNAPQAVIEGCLLAKKEYGVDLVLTGDEEKIRAAAKEMNADLTGIQLVNAPQVMPVEADPTEILKSYSDSSMAVGLKMLSEGKGDAFLSAGSTGALVVGSTLIVKRLKGIKRAALGTVIPTMTGRGNYLLMDAGANHECRPEMLCQFGILGSVYMEKVFGVKSPKVGVVNIGAEETKGLPLQIDAGALLKKAPVNFVGNVEARGLPLGEVDVAVADGFTGNVILKLSEGLGKSFSGAIKDLFKKSLLTKIGYLCVRGGLDDFRKKMDYTEHGGAPLLGLTKPVIKAHGSSNGYAFKNAIRQAKLCCEGDMIGTMQKALEEMKTSTAAASAEE